MKKPPAQRTPGYDDILAIARLIESGSRFTEFRLRSGDIEVEVKRANGAAGEGLGPGPLPVPGARGDGKAATPAQAGAQLDSGPSSSLAPAMTDLPPGTHLIRSPMVGTFYRASEPGAKPFVEPGTKVKPDSIVCIIEVMKLMNSVEAGIKGTVTHVFAQNAAMVEHGQPLLAIRPE
jgi:acetyl-CoA carboxylase biotin carboxyl carrier protein